MPRARGSFGPYRVFFTSFDCTEPPRVHVERDGSRCKFWLNPPILARNVGFRANELGRIERLILRNRDSLMELWNAHCHPR